jgi:hypothetical protein
MTMLRIIRRAETGTSRIEKAIICIEGQSKVFAAHRTDFKRIKRRPDSSFLTAIAFSTSVDVDSEDTVVESEKDNGTREEFLPERKLETSGLDIRGVLVWECPAVAQDRRGISRTSSKRKATPMVEVSRKRSGMDNTGMSAIPIDGVPSNSMGTPPVSGRSFPASAASASVLNRRDTFRQRKPNTSRPPSMHVDDYVARERSDTMISGSSPAPIQRSTSGSGRPPSIHMDEFMAKQQERQQLSVTSSGFDDQQLSAIRNASLLPQDIGRKGIRPGLLQATNMAQEEEAQRSINPQDKGSEQHWEEVLVAETGALGAGVSKDLLDPSHPSAPAADSKAEKTPNSSSLISTTTDSAHNVKTPQVADMLLLQSKVTLQTTVARNLSGAVQTQAQQELVQTASVSSFEQLDVKKKVAEHSTPQEAHLNPDKKASAQLQPWIPESLSDVTKTGGHEVTERTLPNIKQSSDSQSVTNVHPSGGFTPMSERQVREAASPIRRPDPENAVHLSSVRETRHHRASQPKEQITSLAHSGRESPIITLSPQPPYAQTPNYAHQAIQMNSPMAVLERKHVQSISNTDQGTGSRGAVSISYATDPRPRPQEKQGERTSTNISRQTVPPASASPWRPEAGQTRSESNLPPPIASLLSARQNTAPTSVPGPAPPQWPHGEGIVKGNTLSTTSESPWPVNVPNSGFGDEAGILYGMAGRSTQTAGNPSLPVGHSTPHHATSKFQQATLLPLSPQMQSVIGSGENAAAPALTGSHNTPRGYSPQIQGYNNVPALLQPVSYVPPPLPAGRPSTPHAPPLPVNTPVHQQQLHLQFQQQNIMQLQQQQLQARQHQLLQNVQPQQIQQMQQVHHQQHSLGPLPMSVQVPLQVPPLAPPAPPAPPGPPPPSAMPAPSASASLPPQHQQRYQQQESVMLQQVLASPDGIQVGYF